MSQFDIDKAYVSPIDQFLFGFDATHEKTPSQLKEIAKHKRIATMRDQAKTGAEEEALWEAF